MSDSESFERQGILALLEHFISQIEKTRKILFGMSISALVLAPISIGLASYLVTHEHFFEILDKYDEFGIILTVFLFIVIIISIIWLALGIRERSMLKSWNARYSNYLKRKEGLDQSITSDFNLEDKED